MSVDEWRTLDASIRRYFVRQARCLPLWPVDAAEVGVGALSVAPAAGGGGADGFLVDLARHVTGLNHDVNHAGHLVLPDILRAVTTSKKPADQAVGRAGEAGVGRDVHQVLLRCLRAFPQTEDRAAGAVAMKHYVAAEAAYRARRTTLRDRGRRARRGSSRRRRGSGAPSLPIQRNVNEFWEFIVNDHDTDPWLRPHGIGRMSVPTSRTCDFLENKSFRLFQSKVRVDAALATAAHLLLSSELLPSCDRIQARTLRTGARVLLTTLDANSQMPHTDYLPEKESLSHPATTIFRCRNFFILATGADPAALRVWVNSHSLRLSDQAEVDLMAEAHSGLLLHLPPFSIAIFRGDGVHAGAGWDDEVERCAAHEEAAEKASGAALVSDAAVALGAPAAVARGGTHESSVSSDRTSGHAFVYPRSVRLYAYLHPDGTRALPDGVELMATARGVNPYRMRPTVESLPPTPSSSDWEASSAPAASTRGKGKAPLSGPPRGRRFS